MSDELRQKPKIDLPSGRPDRIVTPSRGQVGLLLPPGIRRVVSPERVKALLPDEGKWDDGVPLIYRHLAQDFRGMPIPFAADAEGYTRAVEERLCGMCGRNLDYWVFFVCTLPQVEHRFFKGPGHHIECAKYAMIVLPTNKPKDIWLYRCRGYSIMKDPSNGQIACKAMTKKGLEQIS